MLDSLVKKHLQTTASAIRSATMTLTIHCKIYFLTQRQLMICSEIFDCI